MPVGVSLLSLLEQFRHECGLSTASGQNVNLRDRHKQVIRNTQQRLWDEHQWPHMMIEVDEPILAGQRYYTFDSTLAFGRIEWAKVKWETQRYPVDYKPDFACLYDIHDSAEDERNDPVRYWRHYETNQYEVWPLPESAQTLTFRGVKNLAAFVAESDVASLDDRLIVLFAAARELKRQKSPDADNVLAEANTHLNRLKAQGSKSKPFIMGGGTCYGEEPERLRARRI